MHDSVQVVAFQLAPGHSIVSGCFVVNLGVHVPAISRIRWSEEPADYVDEADCSVGSRLGVNGGPERWWPLEGSVDELVAAVLDDLTLTGVPWLDRWSSLHVIATAEDFMDGPDSIDRAIAQVLIGDRGAARELLRQRIEESSDVPEHVDVIRDVGRSLGLDLS